MKRIVSLILCALMLLSLLPFNALAEEAVLPGDEPVIPSEVEGSIPASVIPSEVEGSVPDFEEDSLSLPPIAENMETSGDYKYTVSDGKAMIIGYSGPGGNVLIPSTLGGYPVTAISDYAFAGCTGLASITIPESVTTIGCSVFANCTNLTSITIPESVTTIVDYAFSGCDNLNYEIFGDTKYLGNSSNPYLVLVEASSTSIRSCTIHPDAKIICGGAFADCMSLASITIPESVTSIGESAFEACTSLTSITIPESVTSIGEGAFWGCMGLTSITIPDSVTTIGSGAFSWSKRLTSITVEEGNPVYHSAGNCLIETASKALIAGCKNSIIPSDGSVTSIDDCAFAGCTSLTSITISNSVTTIGHWTFEGCSSLTSITIPKGVTTIGHYAFYDCTSLATVYYTGTREQWNTITIEEGNDPLLYAELVFVGDGPSYAPESEFTYTVSDGKATITGYVGSGGDVVIPPTLGGAPVTTIGDYAFCDFASLTSITIPESVTTIGEGAFSNCKFLASITIPESVTTIGEGAFGGCSGLRSITIPESVTIIGDHAFSTCDCLTSVTIPESVTTIGEGAFSGCTGLESITVEEGNPVYHSVGNCLIETESKTLIAGCKTSVIPADGSVTAIDDYAFARCTGLTNITIPDSVTAIGDYAFNYCIFLTSITIPKDVTSIGYCAFEGCWGLTSITIPDSVTIIGDYAFCDCNGLTSITIPDSVTTIGYGAFYVCKSLTTVYYTGTREQWDAIAIEEENDPLLNAELIFVEDGPSYAPESDFEYTVEDEKATITKYLGSGGDVLIPPTLDGYPVTAIGNYAFNRCTGLTDVTIPASVTAIGDWAFDRCTSLESVSMVYGITYIGEGAFAWCTSLTEITIPESVTVLYCPFGGCRSLKSVVIPDSVIDIGHEGIFSNCTSLESVTIGKNVPIICTYAFYECTSLTEIIIPENVKEIDDYAFMYCTSLTSITIPENVTTIGRLVFQGCESLASITIPDSVTSIGEGAFTYCTNLESITVEEENPVFHSADNCIIETESKTLIAGCKTSVIPSDGSVTTIGSAAFAGCSGLTSITIPDSVTSIGEGAFTYCANLESITVEEGKSIFHSADNCLIETESKTLIAGCKNSVIPTDGSVTSIGEYAFAGFSGLTEISIPKSVTSIGYRAFIRCTSLTTIYYTGSEEEWNAIIIGEYNDPLLNANIIFNYDPDAILYGDANGDGVVNAKDVVRLKNYFANLDVETGESTYEIFPGADANGDGEVTNKDIVRLKNYFANFDPETGTSTYALGPAA